MAQFHQVKVDLECSEPERIGCARAGAGAPAAEATADPGAQWTA